MSYLANAGQLLIDFTFGALIALVILRVLLQCVRANFYNPICQFLYKLTNPVLMPLRKIIPAWRNLDLAGILLAWLLSAIKLALLYTLAGQGLGVLGLAVMALADLADFVLVLYLGLILVRVLLSFVSLERSNPVVPLVFQLTEPVLMPLRRILPPIGGLDLSPLGAWLIVLLARVLLVAPVLDLGMRLAQGS
ncbi:YggT family protein [Dokdonella sp.]|uniref:YggT family protein n=1 Tax=Dokdonella sp. TaxID=2291710 RepID=UPI0031CC2415|nr:YggT family protein [Dokdonella sp.]